MAKLNQNKRRLWWISTPILHFIWSKVYILWF